MLLEERDIFIKYISKTTPIHMLIAKQYTAQWVMIDTYIDIFSHDEVKFPGNFQDISLSLFCTEKNGGK